MLLDRIIKRGEILKRLAITRPIRGGGAGGFDFYVDSVSGDDSNDGSRLAPFQTLGKVQTEALAFGNGCRIALVGGSSWREMLDLSTIDNVTVSAVNVTTALPLIDAADVISGGSWDDSTARSDANTNVYSRVLTWDGAGGFLSVWRNNTRLAAATSLANCQATAGTFWTSNGVAQNASGAAATVFIHPPGSVDPNSDGATYEFSRRGWAVKLGDNCSAIGLRTRRQTHANGSLELGLNARILACLSEDGVKHEFLIRSGVAERSVAWHPFSDTRTTATGFVAFNTLGDGQSYIFRRCFAKGPRQSGGQAYDGFFAHTSSFTDLHASGLVEDCSAEDCSALGSCSALQLVDRRNWAHNCRSITSGLSLSVPLEVIDGKLTITANLTAVRVVSAAAGNPNALISGLRVYDAGSTGFDAIDFSAGAINIERSVFVLNNDDSFSIGLRVGNLSGRQINISGTIFELRKNSLSMMEWYVAGHQALGTLSNNVYFDNSPGSISFRVDNVAYTLANYLLTFPETGTITTNPGLVDPANGDFNLTAPLANGAGLERPNIEYTPIPEDLAAAEAWVISQL